MSIGLIGKKLGMTTVYDDTRAAVPVTVVEAVPCIVTQIKRAEQHGYSAIQVGYGTTAKKLTNPVAGHLGESGAKTRNFAEFRFEKDADLDSFEIGQSLDVSIFDGVTTVKATGRSKGRGFAGGVKRYGFRGGPKTHGQSDRHRAPGSIGAGTYPGRVIKGTKMAGHYGNKVFTIKGIKLVGVDTERQLLMLKGGVPGAVNSILTVNI